MPTTTERPTRPLRSFENPQDTGMQAGKEVLAREPLHYLQGWPFVGQPLKAFPPSVRLFLRAGHTGIEP